MNVKRYYGQKMPEIMERIRQELGPDALILSDRSFRKGGLFGLFSPKTIEVMVAYEDKPALDPPSLTRSEAISKLTNQVDALSRTMGNGDTAARRASPPAVSSLAVNAYAQSASQADNIPPSRKTPPRDDPKPVPAAAPASTSAPVHSQPKEAPNAARSFVPITREEIPEVYDMRGKGQVPEETAAGAAEPHHLPSLEEQILGSAPPARRDGTRESQDLIVIPSPANQSSPSAGSGSTPENTPPRVSEPAAPVFSAIVPVPAAPISAADERVRLNRLDERIDALQNLLNGFATQLRTIGVTAYEPQVEVIKTRLIDNEVDAELAETIAKRVSEDERADKDEALSAALCDILGGASRPIKAREDRRSVVVMIGPTGVGKTTTLVKLAAHYVVKENLRVGLINTDTFRIAAQEQLKTYADILEIPLGLAYSAEEVEAELEKQSDRDMIFIDTAGKRSSDEKHKQEIRRLLDKSGATDVMLVISATTAPKSIRDIVDNYRFIEDYRLLITKTDEAKTLGMALNACHYASRPLSYVTYGQNVPDDLEIADVRSIAARVME